MRLQSAPYFGTTVNLTVEKGADFDPTRFLSAVVDKTSLPCQNSGKGIVLYNDKPDTLDFIYEKGKTIAENAAGLHDKL